MSFKVIDKFVWADKYISDDDDDDEDSEHEDSEHETAICLWNHAKST
jgi:endoglucanase Acf2